MIYKLVFGLLFSLLSINISFAQTSAATNFIDSTKFMVVISVLSTILVGIFLLLLFLERKISRLEKQLSNKLL